MTRYIIYIKLITGEVIRAFTWRGNKEDGIFRAKIEAQENGLLGVTKVWAEEI